MPCASIIVKNIYKKIDFYTGWYFEMGQQQRELLEALQIIFFYYLSVGFYY